MDKFEQILSDYPELTLYFDIMPDGMKGLLLGTNIYIDKSISDEEKIQVIYEEIGHYETSAGDISDYSETESQKQERKARDWGIKKLIPLEVIKKYKLTADSDYEVAEELGLQVSYLHEAGKIYHILN